MGNTEVHAMQSENQQIHRLDGDQCTNQSKLPERQTVNKCIRKCAVQKLLSSVLNAHVYRTFDDAAITLSRRHHFEHSKMFN